MLKLTKKVEYALKALYYIGVVQGNERAGVSELSATLGLPRRFVEQIFLQLRKAKILKSFRGSQGGYELATPFDRVTLGQVLDALGEQSHSIRGFGTVGEDRFIRMVNEQILAFVRDLRLDELITDRMRALVQQDSAAAQQRMYHI